MKVFGAILGSLGIAAFLWLIIYVPIFGLHYETSKGEHTGYVTAVEKSGVFFKTGTAYVKTDTQSSQEDSYCVIDPDVYSQLQQASLSKIHVNVYYLGWFSAGIGKCNGEGEIIYKVVPLTN
jgi:hypothetical protein